MNTSQGANKIIDQLLLRAKILTKVRAFFARRGVMEVETPLLCETTNPAPYLNNFCCDNLYLQTSPEFAMKKLLAAGSGDIYQICKAFRKDELGRLHNPEFTILEWYRINFDHHKLMAEVDELLIHILNTPKAKRLTYQEVWQNFLDIDPYRVTLKNLKQIAKKNNLLLTGIADEPDTWLQLLFTHLIEPKFTASNSPIFVYDFPAAQAMLAKIRTGKNKVASRFEVYYRGVELANGFHELTNPKEQLRRFNSDLKKRQELNLPLIKFDDKLLKVLSKMPNCAGVAVGFDRLLLLAVNCSSLDEILYFRN